MPRRSSELSARDSTKVEFLNRLRCEAWRTKLSRSPPHDVERMTSGRKACRRLISVEKSAAPNLGNISATTLTSGLNFFSAARKISRESRPQA
ncbi:hypothetical protein D9M68_954120 [compost metagenome]